MKYRKIFVFMLMIVVMTTVYGQERYRAKPASTQLSIYSLPPLERAISCIKLRGMAWREKALALCWMGT